jgi:hypothetical protein
MFCANVQGVSSDYRSVETCLMAGVGGNFVPTPVGSTRAGRHLPNRKRWCGGTIEFKLHCLRPQLRCNQSHCSWLAFEPGSDLAGDLRGCRDCSDYVVAQTFVRWQRIRKAGGCAVPTKTPPTTYVHPPRWDPKSHPFSNPPREPGAYYAAPQPAKPVPAKPTGPRPSWM